MITPNLLIEPVSVRACPGPRPDYRRAMVAPVILACGLRRIFASGMMMAVFALAACVAPSVGGSGKSLSFLGGEIHAEPPRGYCTDPKASHDDGESAVILMGRCSGAGVEPALIAISVGTPGSSALLKSGAKALSDYFISPAGRAALARDGRASSVRVQKTLVAEGALLMRIADRNTQPYWRAVLALRGRLVTISVMASEAEGPDEAEGRRILEAAMAAMRGANPARAASAAAPGAGAAGTEG